MASSVMVAVVSWEVAGSASKTMTTTLLVALTPLLEVLLVAIVILGTLAVVAKLIDDY